MFCTPMFCIPMLCTTTSCTHDVLTRRREPHDRVPDVVVARGIRRRAISLANVIMLTILTLGAVMLFRIGTHRPVMRLAMTADAPGCRPGHRLRRRAGYYRHSA